MAMPKARYVHSVTDLGLAIVSTEPDSERSTVYLSQLTLREMIRAAMNVGIAAPAGGWNTQSKFDLEASITQVIGRGGYVAREWKASTTAAHETIMDAIAEHVDAVDTDSLIVETLKGEVVKASEASKTIETSTGDEINNANPDTVAALNALLATLKPQSAPLDESAIRAMVDKALADSLGSKIADAVAHLAPQVTHVTYGENELVKLEGRQHAQLPTLLTVLATREHAYLYGPPGTGKTTLAQTAAKAMGRKFTSISCSPDMMSSKLLGYQDANGKYVRTAYRDAYEHGYLFLLDEGDNATGAVLTVLNQGLANGGMQFPDEYVHRHDDFVCVLAANTFGTGPTAEFVNRSPLDAATLDRFVRIGVPYDELLERELVLAVMDDSHRAIEWHETVKRYRRNVERHGLKVFVTPRFTVKGGKLLNAGVAQSEVESMVGFCAIPAEQVAKIRGN